jgi:hypothetical protein
MPAPIKVILVVLIVVSSISLPITSTSAELIELQVSPAVVVQGEQLSISGIASPNEEISLSSSFELTLPVVEGNYSCEFNGLDFPQGNKSFSATVRDIKNIRLEIYPVFGIKFEYPLDGPLNATNGIATISLSFPVTIEGTTINIAGEKDVLVYGEALDGATSVNLESIMSIAVTADSEGYFELNLSTSGVPVGEYVLSADGLQKTVQVIAPSPLFDTGSGTYPSTSGVHNGSITPNTTLNISRLYTYPCPGTGGHTEFVRIYNESGTIVEGHWNGYRDDCHNITITPSVTLMADHTYNFTIVTGSYPQIIHAKSKNVTGGTITCSSFVDANGKVYYDWIPAIKLICTGTQ